MNAVVPDELLSRPIVMTVHDLWNLLLQNFPRMIMKVEELKNTFDDLPPILSQSTAAKAIDVSPSTISRWLDDNELKTTWRNGKRCVKKEDLMALIVSDFGKVIKLNP